MAPTLQTPLDQNLYNRAVAKAERQGKTLDECVLDWLVQWVGADESPASPSPAEPGRPPEPETYVVRPGDSLWTIAQKFYGQGSRYPLLAEANQIGDKRRIQPGMQLIIPPLPTFRSSAPIPKAGVAPKPDYPIVPDGLEQLQQVFGSYPYEEMPNTSGRIRVPPEWIQENIATVQIPGLGLVQCHKLLAPVLVNVFTLLQAQGLTTGLKYDGCFVPRHKMWDPSKDLSVHSWGIAIDLNAAQNQVGTAGKFDPQLIRIFAEHGFYWGGHFGDPMHFQYCLGY